MGEEIIDVYQQPDGSYSVNKPESADAQAEAESSEEVPSLREKWMRQRERDDSKKETFNSELTNKAADLARIIYTQEGKEKADRVSRIVGKIAEATVPQPTLPPGADYDSSQAWYEVHQARSKKVQQVTSEYLSGKRSIDKTKATMITEEDQEKQNYEGKDARDIADSFQKEVQDIALAKRIQKEMANSGGQAINITSENNGLGLVGTEQGGKMKYYDVSNQEANEAFAAGWDSVARQSGYQE